MGKKNPSTPFLLKKREAGVDSKAQVSKFLPFCFGQLDDFIKEKIRSAGDMKDLGPEIKHVKDIILWSKLCNVEGKKLTSSVSRLEDPCGGRCSEIITDSLKNDPGGFIDRMGMEKAINDRCVLFTKVSSFAHRELPACPIEHVPHLLRNGQYREVQLVVMVRRRMDRIVDGRRDRRGGQGNAFRIEALDRVLKSPPQPMLLEGLLQRVPNENEMGFLDIPEKVSEKKGFRLRNGRHVVKDMLRHVSVIFNIALLYSGDHDPS
jgi:hypothetical protein